MTGKLEYYVEERAVNQLARSLAEFDGCIIVELDWGWEPRMEPDLPQPKPREKYEEEARRFLHCFMVAKNLSELRQL